VRTVARAAGALAVLLLASGCASGDPDGASSAGPGTGAPSASTAARFHTYVALGDSYTAAPLVPSARGDDGCFRSTHNYPSLVARALGVPDFRDHSCSGATTGDLTGAQQSGVPAQLDAVRPDTDLVTLGIGGNDDAVFSRLVLLCAQLGQHDPHGAPCTAAAARDRTSLHAVMSGVRGRVVAALRAIRRQAPRATVLVVGYPKIFPDHGGCPELPFAAGDYPFAVRVNRALDDALRAAARRGGARYVDVWRASLGHDVCAAAPWINGATTLPGRAAAYHPFGVEQQAVARLVEAALNR
jgi:lysophospholipase L1-like esterase